MNILQKILGSVFPPYKFKTIRQEQGKLLTAIVTALPSEFAELKNQILSTSLYGLDKWTLYPDFKFVSLGFTGDTLFRFKKRDQNFKISGLQIFSKRSKKYENIELLIQDHLMMIY